MVIAFFLLLSFSPTCFAASNDDDNDDEYLQGVIDGVIAEQLSNLALKSIGLLFMELGAKLKEANSLQDQINNCTAHSSFPTQCDEIADALYQCNLTLLFLVAMLVPIIFICVLICKSASSDKQPKRSQSYENGHAAGFWASFFCRNSD